MTYTTPQAHSVAEISAHEAAEQSRIANVKAAFSQEADAKKKEYADAAKQIGAHDRAIASEELQRFGADDIPRMLEAGEAAREKAVADVDKHARATMSSEVKTIVTKACSHHFSF